MKTIFGQQTTKVKQLADLISQDISMGRYKTDTALPSINQLSHDYKVSRDTVFKAFIDLKERGIIDSTPGKGYYVVNRQKNILLLLDEYSPFKDTLYNSIIRLSRLTVTLAELPVSQKCCCKVTWDSSNYSQPCQTHGKKVL